MRVDIEKIDRQDMGNIIKLTLPNTGNQFLSFTCLAARGSIYALVYQGPTQAMIYGKTLTARLYTKFFNSIKKIIKKNEIDIDINKNFENPNFIKVMTTDILELFEGMDPESEEFELYFLLQINNII